MLLQKAHRDLDRYTAKLQSTEGSFEDNEHKHQEGVRNNKKGIINLSENQQAEQSTSRRSTSRYKKSSLQHQACSLRATGKDNLQNTNITRSNRLQTQMLRLKRHRKSKMSSKLKRKPPPTKKYCSSKLKIVSEMRIKPLWKR